MAGRLLRDTIHRSAERISVSGSRDPSPNVAAMSATSVGIPTATELAAHCEGATKDYGSGDTRVRALDHVSVGFGRGVFSAIMGPSGSGKSTLMHCMAGLDSLTEGTTWVGDIELTHLSEAS